MRNLFLIDGVAGSGKSDLISYCSENWDTIFLEKYTTKSVEADGLNRPDLIYLSDEEFNKMRKPGDFIYAYPKYPGKSAKYMIRREALDEALKNYTNVFVIVRSSDVIREIKRKYSKYLNVRVISIFTYCNNDNLEERTRDQLLKANPDMDEHLLKKCLSKRLSRNSECLESYFNSLHSDDKVYDYVIINDLDQRDYYRCIDKLVNKHNNEDDANDDLIAFLIMPMPENRDAAHFDKVKDAVCQGAQRAGFKAMRADDVFASRTPKFNQIKEYIEKATVCIVDLTDNRPNCYFEAGLAFERNPEDFSSTFLIAEQGTKIEFDLQGIDRKYYTYRHNDYSNITRIVEENLHAFKAEHIF